jgi:hypothetical protein
MRCMLHNYNASSIIPERIIKFRLVVTEELQGNKFLSKFAQIFSPTKTMDFVQMR